ncbi:MAG: hypothetical protein WAX77_13680 [Methylococcaceae bacterium]
MSYKTKIIKLAVKWTPKAMVLWVANKVLKGIAELLDFNFDIEARTVYVQTKLYGETETIDVWVNGFAVLNVGKSYQFILEQAQSNKPWLNNIFALITGKPWAIPVLPQLAPYMGLVAELFAPIRVAQTENLLN